MVFSNFDEEIESRLLNACDTKFQSIDEKINTLIEKVSDFRKPIDSSDMKKYTDPRNLKNLLKQQNNFYDDLKESLEAIKTDIKDYTDKKIKIEEIRDEGQKMVLSLFKKTLKQENAETKYSESIQASPEKRKKTCDDNDIKIKKKRPDEVFIDTITIIREIKAFLKKNNVNRTYFSKKALNISRLYFIEIISYPICGQFLSKSARCPYEKMNEFLNNKAKIDGFLEEYKNELERETREKVSGSPRKGNISMVLPIKYADENANKTDDEDNDDDQIETDDTEINIKFEFE